MRGNNEVVAKLLIASLFTCIPSPSLRSVFHAIPTPFKLRRFGRNGCYALCRSQAWNALKARPSLRCSSKNSRSKR